MLLKKVLNQPNLVGTMLIALMVCGFFVYAFAFDGFNVETVTGGEVDAWLAQADGDCNYNCGHTKCPGDAGKKCKKCNSKKQFRCKDTCPKGNPCHTTCMKAGDYWCNGATKCDGCGAT